MDSNVISILRSTSQDFTVGLGDANVTFGKLGINQITHPVAFQNDKSSYSVGTDWISPYIAGAIIGGQQSGNAAAVSGNHGTSGGGGHATANTKSTTIKVDGESIGNGYSGLAKQVEVTIVNEVTLKENINLDTGARNGVDFEETITWVMERNHMKIKNLSIKALKPMYISWYMGPQFTREYNDSIYFTYDTAKSGIYTDDSSRRNSGTKGQSPNMTRATLMNDNDEMLHIYVDKDYGIGYDHIGNDDVIAYGREGNQKFYYHLVKSGNTLNFNTNQTHSYRGGYIFSENYGNNAYVTRFIEDGVKKAFVDFRQATTEQIDYVSIEESQNVTGNGTSLTSSTNNGFAKVVIE